MEKTQHTEVVCPQANMLMRTRFLCINLRSLSFIILILGNLVFITFSLMFYSSAANNLQPQEGVLYEKMLQRIAQKQCADNSQLDLVAKENDFPKIVHRIYGFWDSKMTPEFRFNLYDSCHESLHGYKLMVWNKTAVVDFLATHYPWFISTFLSYRYEVQRVDAARYFIVYHYGGLYLDIDYACIKTLDTMYNVAPKSSNIVLIGTDPWGVTNSIFLAKRCSPFIGYVLSRLSLDNRWYIAPYATVMFSTGPTFMSIKLDSFNTSSAYIISMNDFREVYFSRGGQLGTWHNWDAQIILFFYNYYKPIVVIISIVMAFLIICYMRRFRKKSRNI